MRIHAKSRLLGHKQQSAASCLLWRSLAVVPPFPYTSPFLLTIQSSIFTRPLVLVHNRLCRPKFDLAAQESSNHAQDTMYHPPPITSHATLLAPPATDCWRAAEALSPPFSSRRISFASKGAGDGTSRSACPTPTATQSGAFLVRGTALCRLVEPSATSSPAAPVPARHLGATQRHARGRTAGGCRRGGGHTSTNPCSGQGYKNNGQARHDEY